MKNKYIKIIEEAIKTKQYDILKNTDLDLDDILRAAAYNNYLDIVKYLINSGANVHHYDDAPLMHATVKGHLDIVEYLVNSGANIHADNGYALRCAVYFSHLDVVKYLIKAGINIHAKDDEALQLAAYTGNLNIVKYLCEAGAKEVGFARNLAIHAKNDCILLYAIRLGKLDAVDTFTAEGGFNYILQDFDNNGFLDIVKYLVNETNFHTWNNEVIQSIIKNKYIDKNIYIYLKCLPAKITFNRIRACYKLQRWFKHKLYSPNSNHVNNIIKPHFESFKN